MENRLGDLWSLYDFLNPGLLGSAAEFSRYVKKLQAAVPPDFTALRRLVRPYLLRRLKTDRAIIADLPDKTEVAAWCALSKKQLALYEKSVRELGEKLEDVDGIQRRGLVLAFLMRFKQICNHPSQWLGDGAFFPRGQRQVPTAGRTVRGNRVAPGKGARVHAVSRDDRAAGDSFEPGIPAGWPGAARRDPPVKERQHLVASFQREEGPPFFVLSLKAGGTGLNLTAASHVIHFDRWWNPAVENQATDRGLSHRPEEQRAGP